MANPSKCITLSESRDTARAEFLEVLRVLKWGILLCIHPDSEATYKMGCQNAVPDYMRFSSVWAREPEFIQDIVTALPGGETVRWDEFGHRVIVIDWDDKVALTLSRSEAAEPLEVLYASLVAAGGL